MRSIRRGSFFFQAEDGIRDAQESRGLGDVYKRQPLHSKWIVWSLWLYLLAGACWLPVVWIQMRLRDVAAAADAAGQALPPLYWRYFRWWVVLGIPAFFAFVAVFYLMVAKPA